MTVILGFTPLLVLYALSTGVAPLITDFPAAVDTFGGWVAPAFARGFDALGVFATLLVAAAAITGFSGDWSRLEDRTRTLFAILTSVATATLLAVAGLAVPMVAHAPERASETLLLWLCAWGVMVIALGLSEVAQSRQQLVRARARRVRALRNLSEADLPEGLALRVPARTAVIRATVAAWSVPTIGWALVCLALALVDSTLWVVFPVALLMSYGGVVSLMGWYSRGDLTEGRSARIRGNIVISVGAVLGIVFGISILDAAAAYGILLMLVGVVSAVLFLPRTGTGARLWPYRVILHWRTRRTLDRLDQHVDDAELRVAREREQSAPTDRRSRLRRFLDGLRRRRWRTG